MKVLMRRRVTPQIAIPQSLSEGALCESERSIKNRFGLGVLLVSGVYHKAHIYTPYFGALQSR